VSDRTKAELHTQAVIPALRQIAHKSPRHLIPKVTIRSKAYSRRTIPAKPAMITPVITQPARISKQSQSCSRYPQGHAAWSYPASMDGIGLAVRLSVC